MKVLPNMVIVTFQYSILKIASATFGLGLDYSDICKYIVKSKCSREEMELFVQIVKSVDLHSPAEGEKCFNILKQFSETWITSGRLNHKTKSMVARYQDLLAAIQSTIDDDAVSDEEELVEMVRECLPVLRKIDSATETSWGNGTNGLECAAIKFISQMKYRC